ncbi:MAG: RdgB/HAM1 family non-canonical purine NTP pyrophosphatase [Candidatus Hydrogenedentota bacterium]
MSAGKPARTIVIGSGNRDKAAELRVLLQNTNWVVKGLGEFDPIAEPVEDGDTFEANALLKARYYAVSTGHPAVADDSGIEVDALGGRPGIYSARYAGEGCSYADNNRKLLDELSRVPAPKRGARFVCCAAFVDGNGREHVVRGTVEGRVANAPRGANGFGYDPLFISEGSEQTFGELAPQAKHAISHRGRAFRELAKYLAQLP